jgi:uncharacterized protein (TIGR02147 family)
MIDIFDYSDYRKFISDYQQMKNALNSAFSFRYYAKKAGINSSSFYPQIVKGIRNLTKTTIIKTCIAFKLSDQQAEYFENLVFFNQAKTIKEKNIYFERLIEKQKLRNVKKIKEEQYEYFSAWYHCIIREAIVFVKFDGDYGHLARFVHPQITEKQAKESVQLLLRLGFVKKEGDRYVQSEPLLATQGTSDFQIHQLVSFQIAMLKMAIEAYDRWKQEKRLTSATTFSFSHKNYPQFIDILRDCRSRMMKLAMEDEHPDQVYMLSMNFFPMTDEYPESNADE